VDLWIDGTGCVGGRYVYNVYKYTEAAGFPTYKCTGAGHCHTDGFQVNSLEIFINVRPAFFLRKSASLNKI
jgi:hypothetical protein